MKRIIIDGMNLVFRSFHAFNTLVNDEGVPSGHIFGFLMALQTLKKKHPDAEFIVAWDSSWYRKKGIYVDYKANRSKHDFGDGVKDIRTVLSSMNISQVEVEGEEADDTIASLTKQFVDKGDAVYIYARDKDLLQLVKDGKVIVIWPKMGQNPERVFDEEEVHKKFGVTPQDLACLLTFRGDAIDNVPGANRLRTKTLTHLSETYHTPQTIYASIQNETLTDFERATLNDFENQAHVNWNLVALNKDLQLDIKKGTPDKNVVESYLQKYGIQKFSATELLDLFDKNRSFNYRTGPAIIEFSLFSKELA